MGTSHPLQGHSKRHEPTRIDRVPVTDHPISYRFRDKRRFGRKSQNSSHPPPKGSPVEFCKAVMIKKLEECRRKSLTICSFV